MSGWDLTGTQGVSLANTNKIALVVNGDAHEDHGIHRTNVANSVRELKAAGYTVYVASPEKPSGADEYNRGTYEGLEELIQGLKTELNDNTDLVIYTTGHGHYDTVENENGLSERVPTLCLEDGCVVKAYTELLDITTYGRRTIIMDQCYSGGTSQIFLDDPNTLFISTGNADRSTKCTEFAPFFWESSKRILDLNHDQLINWQERFAFAVNREISSSPQFLMSEGYMLEGTAPFQDHVISFDKNAKTEDSEARLEKEKAWIDSQIKRLQPGQYAFINFSTDWCAACQSYFPVYESFAQEAKGQFLFLYTKNDKLADEYGVKGIPCVAIVDHSGNVYKVQDRTELMGELRTFKLSGQQQLTYYREQIASSDFHVARRASSSFGSVALKQRGHLDLSYVRSEIVAIKNTLLNQEAEHNVAYGLSALVHMIEELPFEEAVDEVSEIYVFLDDPRPLVQSEAIEEIARLIKIFEGKTRGQGSRGKKICDVRAFHNKLLEILQQAPINELVASNVFYAMNFYATPDFLTTEDMQRAVACVVPYMNEEVSLEDHPEMNAKVKENAMHAMSSLSRYTDPHPDYVRATIKTFEEDRLIQNIIIAYGNFGRMVSKVEDEDLAQAAEVVQDQLESYSWRYLSRAEIYGLPEFLHYSIPEKLLTAAMNVYVQIMTEKSQARRNNGKETAEPLDECIEVLRLYDEYPSDIVKQAVERHIANLERLKQRIN